MEHTTSLFERDCLTEGNFIILETSTGNEDTGKLHGIVIAARFSAGLELKTIYQPMKYSIDLKPEDYELFDESEIVLKRKIDTFKQWTNSFTHQAMSNVYKDCLKKMDLVIKNSQDTSDSEYLERMEKAFGEAEENWDSIQLDRDSYSKYKEFFDKIEKAFAQDYPELKLQLNNLH